MEQRDQIYDEARVLEHNMKEGIRAVFFWWFVRRFAAPVMGILVVSVGVAFAEKGFFVGMLSALLVSLPLLLLWRGTSAQWQKVKEYWKS